eukprot:6189576-Pleurochrysis_carterae.AAC.7
MTKGRIKSGRCTGQGIVSKATEGNEQGKGQGSIEESFGTRGKRRREKVGSSARQREAHGSVRL